MQKLNNKRVFCTPYDDQRIVTAKIKNEKHYVLKACPFCGRKPVIETVEPISPYGKVQYRYEHMFKALGCPLYDIQMPYGKGIKASGKNRFHRSSPKYLI